MRYGFLVILALALAAGYYYGIYPPQLYRQQVQEMLTRLGAAVEMQNIASINRQLSEALAEDAEVELEVRMPGMAPNQNTAVHQRFSKTEFATFVDTILYSVKDYHFEGRVQAVLLPEDASEAHITFTVSANAQGASAMLGEAGMNITSQSSCKADAPYSAGTKPRLRRLSCVMDLRYALAK